MKKNILVFPCGSEVGLEIYRSFEYSKDFRVYGASSVNDHGRFLYKDYIPNIPFVEHQDFLVKLKDVIAQHNIDFVFPAHDSVVLCLAQNEESIEARLLTSPVETCTIARSKRKTYETLAAVLRVPKLYASTRDHPYPAFLKPDVGQGSKGTVFAKSADVAEAALSADPELLLMEYLPGREYTIDCFTDLHGRLLFSQARERVRIANGISVNSRTVNNPEFDRIAKRINKVLAFRGVWFFQLKESNDSELVLLEVAPRVAGSMAVSRMMGVNLPLLTVYDAMDLPVTILTNPFAVEIDRALAARYTFDFDYDTAFIDLDDTVIVDGHINYLLVGLLYRLADKRKRLVLITKHAGNVRKTLLQYRICPTLFDKIIHLGQDERKCDHMTPASILIDDSYAERKAVLEAPHVLVLDVNEAIELLLNSD